MKIMAVDDDSICLDVLQATLEADGHEVVAAENGAEALARVLSDEIRLVVSDWIMPGLDGIKLCRKLRMRQKEGQGYVYVILLTSQNQADDRLAGLIAGADDFIVKPFDPEELKLRVRTGARILAIGDARSAPSSLPHAACPTPALADADGPPVPLQSRPRLIDAEVLSKEPPDYAVQATGLSVLLIEDSEVQAEMAQAVLKERGHRAQIAFTAGEGLAAIAHTKFDAIALDYRLPDVDGLDLLPRIQHIVPETPIVFNTAAGNEQVVVTAMKGGASDYVIKRTGWERVMARAVELAAAKARMKAAENRWLAELERRATIDDLTGISSRGEMERLILSCVAEFRRDGSQLSFSLLDVDHFKAVNDRFGHQVGDEVLRGVAAILSDAVKPLGGQAARWGGDEFAMLLPQAGLGKAREVAKALHAALEGWEHSRDAQRPPGATLSIGFVTFCASSYHDLPEVVRCADRALYAAKAAGRNQAKFLVLGTAPQEEEEPEVAACSA